MPSRQEQSGGAESVNVQAGQNATVHVGITPSEARNIALDVFNSNFLTLRGIAEDVAYARAERITRDFLETLQARNPAGLASMGDPDMLRALYSAQEGYAYSGEDDLEKALTDLLVDRAGQAQRDLKTHVLNQAITTLPKLTQEQRAFLAVVFFVKHSRFVGPYDLPPFYRYVTDYLAPFADKLPRKSADAGYMQYTGVGSIGYAGVTLEAAFYEQAYGYFMNGFTRENAAATWTPFLNDPEVFIPCLRDPQKLQIKARSLSELRELASVKSIPTLQTHAATGRMQDSEIRADLIAHAPSLEMLFDKWGSIGLSSFQLTGVGIAIGHACQRKIVPESAPLDVFLI